MRYLVREFSTISREYEVEASSKEEARNIVASDEVELVSSEESYDGMEVEEIDEKAKP